MNDAQDAYDRLIRPIEGRMIQSIWRIVHDRADAEDALQNALIQIWKQWDRVSIHPNPPALVLKICFDAAYDVGRRRQREKRASTYCDDLSAPKNYDSPDSLAMESENRKIVIESLRRLPRQQALAVVLRAIDQTYEDIAMAMGCSIEAARKHTSLGRQKLRADLCDWFNLKITRESK